MENRNNPLSEQIGLRLKSARKAAGFKTARSFAALHQIPYSTYSQHETGKRAIPLHTLLQYSQLLCMDSGWLLNGKNDSSQSGQLNSLRKRALEPIKEFVTVVDIRLMRKILKSILSLCIENPILHRYNDFIVDSFLDMYNILIVTSGKENEQSVILDLLMASLKRQLRESSSTDKISQEESL